MVRYIVPEYNKEPFLFEKVIDDLWYLIEQIKGFNKEEFNRDVVEPLREFLNSYKSDTITESELEEAITNILEQRGHTSTLEAYLVYRAQKSIVKSKRINPINLGVPYHVIFETSVVCGTNNCITKDQLIEIGKDRNRIIELLDRFESYYYMQIKTAAIKIKEKIEKGARLIIIAGPSSSNKTSTTLWITRLLKEEFGIDLNLYPLHVDDYFKDKEEFPIDKYGDPDYESPDALKIDLINKHIRDLIDGKEIEKPIYSFHESKQVGVERVSIPKDSIVLIDCLHGLIPPITSSVPEEEKIKVYIECMPVLTLGKDYADAKDFRKLFVRWTDWRIMRRSVRDDQSRGTNPYQTFGHWHYVRKWELRSLIPYLIDVDITINSYNPVEIYFFKHYLYDKLDNIISGLEKEGRQDGSMRARRVKKLLDGIPAFSDISILKEDSPLLEFIAPSKQKII